VSTSAHAVRNGSRAPSVPDCECARPDAYFYSSSARPRFFDAIASAGVPGIRVAMLGMSSSSPRTGVHPAPIAARPVCLHVRG
jgi:hypothetical protein